MLVDAYTAAAEGDYEPLNTLQTLFSSPYDEQPAMVSRFLARSEAARTGETLLQARCGGGLPWRRMWWYCPYDVRSSL